MMRDEIIFVIEDCGYVLESNVGDGYIYRKGDILLKYSMIGGRHFVQADNRNGFTTWHDAEGNFYVFNTGELRELLDVIYEDL